ncbi:MAG: HD domain-containing protein [Chloroflexi bacterium]|nr:HD domain-containing protein [Chloroflexota bacterium]MBI3732121.1 HD domain-containing protein [Chloroflexota bacterium]
MVERPPLVTIEHVRRDPQAIAFLQRANEQMNLLGYTEHGHRHAALVGNIAYNILVRLGHPERVAQLAEIAGYLHDSGNVIHREGHAHSGALIAMQVLSRLGMAYDEIAIVMGAIGNHEEERGDPVGHASAAVIIADKADVHRSRVQNPRSETFDIHDMVNNAATRSFVRVDAEKKVISMEIDIDTSVSQVGDFFEIYLSRLLIARRAAKFLGCEYHLLVNGVRTY